MDWVGIFSDFFLLLGTFNIVVCGAGMLSFRDVYSRISVLSTASGFGVSFIVIGVFWRQPDWLDAIIVLVSIILLLGTSAIGSILISRAALLRRVRIVDERYNEASTDNAEPIDSGVAPR